MIEILGQKYLSIDQHVDLKNFEDIVDDIILGIAKSKYAAGPTYTGPGYLDKSKKSVHEIYREIISDPNHPYFNVIKNLKNWEPYNFIQYKWNTHVLNQCLILRSSGLFNYQNKSNQNECKDFEIINNFPKFIKWIKNLNFFSSIGRIIIFLNEPGTKVLEHRDYYDGISRKDQFLWINPLKNKKFYIRDDFEKIYIDSIFSYFDNANIHGAEESDCSTFSIRIDGIFSENFKLKTNLKQHLND